MPQMVADAHVGAVCDGVQNGWLTVAFPGWDDAYVGDASDRGSATGGVQAMIGKVVLPSWPYIDAKLYFA